MEKNYDMNIWELRDYAEKYGYNCGRFICASKKGFSELKWLDAYLGLIQFLQPKIDGFVTVEQLVEIYGRNQKYLPTFGYEKESED
jgi:hypothetical protein